MITHEICTYVPAIYAMHACMHSFHGGGGGQHAPRIYTHSWLLCAAAVRRRRRRRTFVAVKIKPLASAAAASYEIIALFYIPFASVERMARKQ